MSLRALKTLLRECAVLLTALAFIMSGSLTPRQHAEAAAFGGGAAGFVICHPLKAGGGDPAKPPPAHHCDQCALCHLVGLEAGTPAQAVVMRVWRHETPTASGSGHLRAARAALPFATGPPSA